MNNTYTLQHTISYSEVDSFYKLRLDHIFSHFQNIADLHSNGQVRYEHSTWSE